jgi:CRP-like cAMP-binding protein
MSNTFVVRLAQASNLQPYEVIAIDGACRQTRQVAAKTYLSRAGDDAQSFPVILAGWAASYQILRNGARQITRLLLPGDAFYLEPVHGPMGGEEVTTISACTIAHVSQPELRSAMAALPAVGEAMRGYAAMENAILANWVVNVGRRDALERIAHLICEVHYRLSVIDPELGSTMFFPLTQDDLADVLGLTPVHINRKLQQMRQEGLITLKSRQLTICNHARLAQIAGFDSLYLCPRAAGAQMPMPAIAA